MGSKDKRGINIKIMEGDGKLIIDDAGVCVIINDRNIIILEKSMIIDQVNMWEIEMKDEYSVCVEKR